MNALLAARLELAYGPVGAARDALSTLDDSVGVLLAQADDVRTALAGHHDWEAPDTDDELPTTLEDSHAMIDALSLRLFDALGTLSTIARTFEDSGDSERHVVEYRMGELDAAVSSLR